MPTGPAGPVGPGPAVMEPPMGPPTGAPGIIQSQSTFSDPQLLEMWTRWKKESFDQRWVFERQWQRNIHYMANRQWITFNSHRGQWQDKRLAKWIPRPVTNVCKEAVNSVRANFTAINYAASGRPIGDDPKNVITADLIADFAPVLHEDYRMDAVMNEADWWMLTTGNFWLHTCVNYERQNGVIGDAHETCLKCQQDWPGSLIAKAKQHCPNCHGSSFMPTLDQDGEPVIDQIPLPKGQCLPLSPFEIAYPLVYERYDLSPYTIRMRWRDKSYYEQNDELVEYSKKISFGKSPADRTMQIFKSLPFENDLGGAMSPYSGGGASSEAEGIVEYDVWIKPCVDFPEGQVIRIAGDNSPLIIHSEKESLPGPLPYHDAKGNPRFTFHHARYDATGGRSLGSSLIDPIIQKQDQLNQMDSHVLMVIGRMANPIWLEPKGAEVEKFTGEPGLVVKWNPLVAGGNAKPERIPGEGINQSIFAYRQLIKEEIEELTGTFDILKGQKPAGVEAFSALNLLVERGQARHAPAFKERGTAYKGAISDALEIEREFGPDSRIRAMMMPTRQWAFKAFMKADLTGSIEVMIEDGSLTPKTSLGERAAIEHLRQLGLLNPTDPDQVMAIFEKFGQSRLLPGLDAQVQEAWMVFDRFEKFLSDPQAISQAAQQAQIPPAPGQPPASIGPLTYKRWYSPQIFRQEAIKWALSDRGRQAFSKSPAAEQYFDQFLATIDIALAQAAMGMLDSNGIPLPAPNLGKPGGGGAPGGPQGPPSNKPGGPGMAAGNSNQNSGSAGPNSSSSVANQGPQPAPPPMAS